MRKIDAIDNLNRARLVLVDGSVVVGKSWNIDEAEDDDGETLGYDLMIFKVEGLNNPLSLREEDILSFEKIA